MNSLTGALIGLLFFAWFVLSVASQVWQSPRLRFPWLDALGLIPQWTFFAPRPGMHDVHLLYRDRLRDGRVTRISYIPMIEARRLSHAIWYPRKYRNKVLADVVISLGRQIAELKRAERDIRILMLSPSYLMALHLVMQMPRPVDAQARQFILAQHRSLGSDPDPHLLFMSNFHQFV